jgi:hypothetical protein
MSGDGALKREREVEGRLEWHRHRHNVEYICRVIKPQEQVLELSSEFSVIVYTMETTGIG